MKHKLIITIILLSMFLVTQVIGLFVVSIYAPTEQTIINLETGEKENITTALQIPYGMSAPEEFDKTTNLTSLILSFTIAILLIFFLIKYKWKFLIKIWFFSVIAISLSISFISLMQKNIPGIEWLILIVTIPLSFFKIYKPNIYIHNFTELFIYPGIAVIFVSMLNIWTSLILLVIISFYDMWAVWHSGIMQKMAKFQMKELKIFGGFLIPYLNKSIKNKINKNKKNKKKLKKVKVPVAILGGGDVVFPIIVAGTFLYEFGILPAIATIVGAFIGLTFLLLISQKKKFYPAMPFITIGIFLGLAIWYLFIF